MKIETKLILSAILFLSVSCSENKQQKGYVADGEFYVPETEIYLCIERGYSDIDTIATTKIINNKFKFDGIAEMPSNAYIICDGHKKIPLILENTKYNFKIDILDYDKIIVENSGYESKIDDNLEILIEEYNKKRDDIYQLVYKGEITEEEALKRSAILKNEYNKREDNLIISPNPDSFVAMNLVYDSRNNLSDEQFCERFDLLGDKYSSHASYEYMSKIYKIKKSIQVGKTAPDFKMTSESGEEFSLYDIKPKFKVLYFNQLNTLSEEDRDGIFKSIYKKYDRNDFEIVELSLEYNKKDWLKELKTSDKKWLQIYLPGGWESPISAKYNLKCAPYIYFLDSENKFIYIGTTATEIKKILNSKL